jgi:hypothetical protein
MKATSSSNIQKNSAENLRLKEYQKQKISDLGMEE